MKKFYYMLLALAISFSFYGFIPSVVSAEETPFTKIELNYLPEGNCLPAYTNDDYEYSISLYDENDTNFSNPIVENIGYEKYLFPRLGNYLARYKLYNKVNGQTSYTCYLLSVLDTTPPELFLDGAYDDMYVPDLEVRILGVQIYDFSEISKNEYRVYKDSKDITSEIKNGKITVKAGEYKIVYTVADVSGNTNSLETSFLVSGVKTDTEEKSANGKTSGCGANIYVDVNFFTLVLVVLIIGCLSKKRIGGNK